jgi:hypothetical protein
VKIAKLLSLITSFLMVLSLLAGCQQKPALKVTDAGEEVPDKKMFDLKLYSDKQTYKPDEKINIWATLEYIGDTDEIKIWSGDPYLVYSITDGKDFNLDTIVSDILKSTTLKKGIVYRDNYIKSGGYSTDAPDADFWKKFFEEKDLYLPEGEYTIKVSCAFSLTQAVVGSEYHQSADMKINVEK